MKKLLSLLVAFGVMSWMVGCGSEPAPVPVTPPPKEAMEKYKNSPKPDADKAPDADKTPDADKVPDADKPEDKAPPADKPEDKDPDADKPTEKPADADKPADKADEPK